MEVEEYWQVTHTPLFVREYQIEYRELGGNETRKQPSRVEQMLRFEGSNLGVIEIGAGACGLQWVRQIHPLRWVRLDDGPAPHLRPLIAELPDGSTMRVAAVIELDDGTMIPSPEALVDFAKTRPPGFLQGLRLRDESASNEPERQ